MSTPSNTYTIDPKRLKKNKTEVGCFIIFLVIWIPVTVFTTLYVLFYPNWFLYFWITAAWLGTFIILYHFTSLKRKITLKIEMDELIISGMGYSPRREKRIHKNDIKALALEVYDEDSFLSLTLWKKGSIAWRIHLTSFIHPRHMVTIYEDIKDFLRQHDFEFEARSSIPPEEGLPALAPEELAAQNHSKAGRIARYSIGVFVGIIITFTGLILLTIGLAEKKMAETSPIFFCSLVLVSASLVFFVGGYIAARITWEDKSYDGLVVGIVSLCLFAGLFLVATRDVETNEYIPELWKTLIYVLIMICSLLFVFCSFLGARVQKKRSEAQSASGPLTFDNGNGHN